MHNPASASSLCLHSNSCQFYIIKLRFQSIISQTKLITPISMQINYNKSSTFPTANSRFLNMGTFIGVCLKYN